MNTGQPSLRRLRLLESGVGLYLLAAVGRLIYEGINARGVYGWLADVQMQRLGHFDEKLTLVGAAAVYLLPTSPFLKHIKRVRAGLAEAEALNPKTHYARREAVATARLFMGLGLCLALAGGIGYYVMRWQNEATAHRRVERFPVETLAGLPAAELAKLKFVQIDATCQTRAGYRWTETDSQHLRPETHHRCLALTPPDWRPGQTARFFLQTGVDVYYPPADGAPDQPFLPKSYEDAPFAGSFEGELSRDSLPAFVSEGLRRAGLAIDAPHYVLEQMTLHGQPRLFSAQEMRLAPLLGGFVGLVFLLTGVLMYWRREGYAARIAARRDRRATL